MQGNAEARILKFIDAGDALGEVLFGLIMALTFTIGARLVIGHEGLNERDLILATLGCNIAWGVIDAVLFLLGMGLYRRNRANVLRSITTATDERSALEVIAHEFFLDDGPMRLDPCDQDQLQRYLLVLARRAKSSNVRISAGDLIGASIVFVIVAATAIPAVIPFLLIEDSYLALRVSNLLLVALLYATGYAWARVAGSPPVPVGIAMTVLGLVLVTVAVILGG